MVFLAFIGLAVLGGLLNLTSRSGTGHDDPVATPAQPDPKNTAISEVTLDFSWSKGGFDNVMLANFIIHNNSAYTIKDVEITCHHYAKSGTRIDSNKRTIFDMVRPHGKKRFPAFSMGFINSQVSSSNCKITDLVAY